MYGSHVNYGSMQRLLSSDVAECFSARGTTAIKISSTRSQPLSLNEIQLFDEQGTNVALSAQCYSKSSSGRGDPNCLNDGKIGWFPDEACITESVEARPDNFDFCVLAEEVDVRRIRIDPAKDKNDNSLTNRNRRLFVELFSSVIGLENVLDYKNVGNNVTFAGKLASFELKEVFTARKKDPWISEVEVNYPHIDCGKDNKDSELSYKALFGEVYVLLPPWGVGFTSVSISCNTSTCLTNQYAANDSCEWCPMNHRAEAGSLNINACWPCPNGYELPHPLATFCRVKMETDEVTHAPTSIPSQQTNYSSTPKPSFAPSTIHLNNPHIDLSAKPSIKMNVPSSEKISTAPSMRPRLIQSSKPSSHPSPRESFTSSVGPSTKPTTLSIGKISIAPSMRPRLSHSSSPSVYPSLLNIISATPMVPSTKPIASSSGGSSTAPSLRPRQSRSSKPSSHPSPHISSTTSMVPSTNPSTSSSEESSPAPSMRPRQAHSPAPSVKSSPYIGSTTSMVPSTNPSTSSIKESSTAPSMRPRQAYNRTPSVNPSPHMSSTTSTAPSLKPSTSSSERPRPARSPRPSSTHPTVRQTSIPTTTRSKNPSAPIVRSTLTNTPSLNTDETFRIKSLSEKYNKLDNDGVEWCLQATSKIPQSSLAMKPCDDLSEGQLWYFEDNKFKLRYSPFSLCIKDEAIYLSMEQCNNVESIFSISPAKNTIHVIKKYTGRRFFLGVDDMVNNHKVRLRKQDTGNNLWEFIYEGL